MASLLPAPLRGAGKQWQSWCFSGKQRGSWEASLLPASLLPPGKQREAGAARKQLQNKNGSVVSGVSERNSQGRAVWQLESKLAEVGTHRDISQTSMMFLCLVCGVVSVLDMASHVKYKWDAL